MQTAAGFGHFFAGHDREAACLAATALRFRPNFQSALRLSAASNALSGNIPLAQQAMQRLQALDPSLRLSNLKERSQPFRRSEDLAKYAQGLRRAGLQES